MHIGTLAKKNDTCQALQIELVANYAPEVTIHLLRRILLYTDDQIEKKRRCQTRALPKLSAHARITPYLSNY